jgi:ABC-type nitrate/sulfonate/bicarbonate transport system substrate-binding protein
MMPTRQPDLWNRIRHFELDDPAAAFSFTDRLARENGWPLEYALRAVLEYKKFMFLGDLVDIPYTGVITAQSEIKNNRDRVQRTISALLESVTWIRGNRSESAKMIADKFKVTTAEGDRTYETMINMLSTDGRLPLKVARGYLDVLRQERPIAADFDVQKLVDFSMLPGGR